MSAGVGVLTAAAYALVLAILYFSERHLAGRLRPLACVLALVLAAVGYPLLVLFLGYTLVMVPAGGIGSEMLVWVRAAEI